jgi:CRISPR-associated protein Cmx8
VDRDGKSSYEGFCLAVPDVSSLQSFCEDYELLLQQRSNDVAGFRPKDSIICVPQEAGLDVMRRLSQVVQESSGKAVTRDLLFGVDVLHVNKDGNNVRLLYAGRVEPVAKRDQRYAATVKGLKDYWFRRQRIVNLLKGANWYSGFDKLLTELPLDQGLRSVFFALDARESFRAEEETHKGELIMATAAEEVCIESLILKIVDGFLRRRLKDKYQLEWSKLKTDEQKKDYGNKKEALGSETFYAIRSRAVAEEFINYFASTICSVPHWMSSEEYLSITRNLYAEPDKVRTLTMLALSARIGRGESKDGGKENNNND